MNPSERAVYTAPVNLECGINHGMGQKKAEAARAICIYTGFITWFKERFAFSMHNFVVFLV